MFRHPAWAVGSYSSGPPAARTVGTKSTGRCYQRDGSPCRNYHILKVCRGYWFPQCFFFLAAVQEEPGGPEVFRQGGEAVLPQPRQRLKEEGRR